MKKNVLKGIMGACIITGLIIVQVSPTFADVKDYVTENNHVLIGGVTGRHYYITKATESKYVAPINNAINDWKSATGNLVSFTRTYDTYEVEAQATIRAKSYPNYPYNDANGYTEFYNKKIDIDKVQPNYCDWQYTEVHLNTYRIQNYSSDLIKGVVAHEMGHTFGLDDNNSNPGTIMCQTGSGRNVTQPQSGDVAGINYLYK
ncbi:hypothetical protein B0P06_003473 [Clostridium saccharoperbutylacetonicum]|uniref:Peptidase M10 metallopeptidase domain-containing protein n=1 Tax=Clostridium saccharoperbutylacetonicum N1-4(HMT) TaxID=931276 RepID=M1MJY5_9CLOT|nr:matrixin family metalloprotease [Clostridium saccharoperbutylacetonicum]AGF58214.1 hypothetical protein Cspa_c44610 [Clostridium saccharoperbutylacetonicum N1-4(HMT)]NRT61011.1 hypothetical protein [Clostridium saccharoperbutylacetonicum]NSB24326.1 hypothetical protein [Clostridium saccharoperbutylacetonicum]NSB43702.1 hypothetical protein [Clostridium saccharoperbutylacetonicum]